MSMYPGVKRFFDLLVALVLVVLILPLMVPIMIGLRCSGEGYVFYFQDRVGKGNRVFSIWKFATMLKNSPDMAGGIITTRRDPRILPMGGFLRKTKINELPQLINVIKGDMSFVGPRPVMQKSFDQYPQDVQEVIYQVTPGITGVGSLIFRNEEELISAVKSAGGDTWAFYKDVIYPYKGKVEQWYQQHRSFTTDCLILWMTAWAIVRPDSKMIYQVFQDLPTPPTELVQAGQGSV
ncbi:MAG: sugar transferase [Saprospiraceae bacterium]